MPKVILDYLARKKTVFSSRDEMMIFMAAAFCVPLTLISHDLSSFPNVFENGFFMYQQGESGNELGRRVGSRSLTKKARADALEALAVLSAIMRNESASVDVRALAAVTVVNVATIEKPIICSNAN